MAALLDNFLSSWLFIILSHNTNAQKEAKKELMISSLQQ